VNGTRRPIATLEAVDLDPGTGATDGPGKCLFVHYTGRLLNGTTFDSSRDTTRDGQPRPPIAFPQGFRRVIAGWDAGFEGLRVGGRRRLIIPYQFGYGEAGRPPAIPPRSVLVFDVELVAITDTLAVREADGRFPACPGWSRARNAPAMPLPDGGALSAADSALVQQVLSAEQRGDAAAPALASGLSHPDPRVQMLAWRARARMADPRFAARDSLPPVRAAAAWPEPAWRLRLRALRPPAGACGPLHTALGDSAWPVRFRAMDLADSSCARDSTLAAALASAARALPRTAERRESGQPSWHAAAHAMVALARVQPGAARPLLRAHVMHPQWQVRAYAARAAAVMRDTATLRRLSADPSDNVAETALEALNALVGHADDARYLAALSRPGAPVVRAAAKALTGSADPRARPAASAAFDRWVAKGDASAHDARVALLAAAGRPATDDRPPPRDSTVPPLAAALAWGRDVRVRVTLTAASGGGSFVVRLRGDVAPIMAARIAELAERRYYDGLTWHRVEHDFVIQGGSPAANEYVGLPSFLRDELGTVAHPRGTVGMSTRGHDTGDAQWFVNLRDNRRLVRDYTVFGEVVEGMDVVDGVLEGDTIATIRVIPSPAVPR
jgi:cyclophilin family peptidyl-prolyl cis-trans isomerase